ncbi:hypothetical protein MVEG_12148 [Podila verticillata NRRL 6337]|uniref:FAD-binding domain-containing protein n=1 Tax=Podila verticillata NRRL 6337 TaxID=1069443 RepID=A0A086TJ67_9FUNG|nr:hypothetical protein MVEG_12148 [Podila verticillata NRRL 6337]
MAPDPVIIIVGAGIAGLTMAIMLERAGMTRYVVLERHASLKPLGSALLLSAMSLRCFDQLGLLPEIIKISKPQIGSVWLDEYMNYLGEFDGSFIGKRYGYFNIVMTRPDLVDILARHVPAHKIYYSKKVLSLTQTSEMATVRCSDYSLYQGDIVIGCDGAYSGIRQNIYKAIQAEYQEINVASLDNKRLNSVVKPLPKSDMAPLRFDQHAIVGVTGKLDADKYPFLREKSCQSVTVFRGSLSFWLFPLAHDRIAWCIGSRNFSEFEQNRERSPRVPSPNSTPTTATTTHDSESPSVIDSSNIFGIAPGSALPPQNINIHCPLPKAPSMLSVATADTSASVATNATTATASTFPTTPCFNGSPSSTFSNRKKNKLSSVFRGREGPAENFKISEWAPDAVDEMLNLKVLREQISPYGGTIGDLFDKTPKGNAVKIMLEDKSFKTWHYKRTVLVGDACHKLIPFSGIGSVHAVMDCITLMNALYDMPDGDQFTSADISKAFQTYHALRYKSASAAVMGSRQTSHILSGTGALNEMIRKGTVRGMPQYLISVAADRIFASRPILTYLPFVPDYGTRKSDPQPLGRRDREELELLRERQRIERQNQLKAKTTGNNNSNNHRMSVSGILRNGASRILQSYTPSSTATSLLRGGTKPSLLLPSSSASTSSGLLALDLPKHNNLMARPQFLKRHHMTPPLPPPPCPLSEAAASRASVDSIVTDITDRSIVSPSSRVSVYSYYSSAIEDYQFMAPTPSQNKGTTEDEGEDEGQGEYDEEDDMCSNSDCSGSCCSGSSCSGSSYSRSTYTESDVETEKGVAASLPYNAKDLTSGYYIRKRGVYPYMDKRQHKKMSSSSYFSETTIPEEMSQVSLHDNNTDACRNNNKHRSSFYSKGGKRRNSSSSLVSTLFRRYGTSGSVSRSTSSSTGYGDPAKLESSVLNHSTDEGATEGLARSPSVIKGTRALKATASLTILTASTHLAFSEEKKKKGKVDFSNKPCGDSDPIKMILLQYEREEEPRLVVSCEEGSTAVMHLERILPEEVESEVSIA